MTNYHDPVFVAAREKLTQAVKDYAQAIEPDDSHLVLGATVVYETTRFDDDATQIYAMRHVILDPGSLVHAVGLLETARDRLIGYINENEEDED